MPNESKAYIVATVSKDDLLHTLINMVTGWNFDVKDWTEEDIKILTDVSEVLTLAMKEAKAQVCAPENGGAE